MREGGARFLLLFLAGHLCCLCGFEIARAWDFFRVDFRPLTVLSVLAAFVCAAWLKELAPGKRPVGAGLLVAWVSVAAFPLVVWEPLKMAVVGVVSVLLCGMGLRGKALGAGVFLSLLLPIAVKFVPTWLGALLLATLAAVEVKSRNQREPDWVRGGTLSEGMATQAEIYWKGFATLYRSTAPGEGQKFKESVVGDTLEMIRACGGSTQTSSDNRALYAFPSSDALEGCYKSLYEYSRRIDGVLDSVKAPRLQLVFKRKAGQPAISRPVPPN